MQREFRGLVSGIYVFKIHLVSMQRGSEDWQQGCSSDAEVQAREALMVEVVFGAAVVETVAFVAESESKVEL
jgi:hypothetical protein